MTRDRQSFLRELVCFPAHSFEGRFCQTSTRLGLGSALSCDELVLLYEAAFYATLCNIAFNGLGGCRGTVKPQRESTRRNLEKAFMAARDSLYASAGWNALPVSPRGSVERVFLNVFVASDNLAW